MIADAIGGTFGGPRNMSALATFIAANAEQLLAQWTTRLAPLVPASSESELRDHVPMLLDELVTALRTGALPNYSPNAKEHGRQRFRLGFDIEIVVREYGLLRDVILDAIEHAAVPFTMPEVRILTGFLTEVVAEGVTEHLRQQGREREHAAQRTATLSAEARANARQLQSITDALPFLISYFDASERYVFVNKAYEDWFGRARETIVGTRLVDLIGDDAYARMKETIDRGLAGEQLTLENHAVPYRYGGTRDVQVTYAPQRDDGGAVTGVVALVEDVTKRRQLELERNDLEERERLRSDFERQLIGIVSHDLRNPLNVVLLGAQMMMAAELAEPMRKQLGRIQSAAERANRLVRDLLDFTQARLGGGIPIDPRPADLHALLRAMIDELAIGAPTRTIELEDHGDGAGMWDPDRIAQVFQNLISNALKYSPPNSTVRVSCEASEDAVVVTVHNEGPPIVRTKLGVLFEPYERGNASPDGANRSVGLGLYIVKQIVESHGGTVVVTSTATEGTNFVVTLPRVAPLAT
jgi:PAS domain S-box-containing protein